MTLGAKNRPGRLVLFLGMALLDPTMGLTDVPAAGFEFFEGKVRPLLATVCYKCHSAQAKELKGGLRLDSREAVLAGGDSGPAIVPGKPDQSLLLNAVRYQSLAMPPDGKLTATEIEVLARWIELGAPWPSVDGKLQVVQSKTDYDWQHEQSKHWAWQSIRKPELPVVENRDWPQNPIDRFVLAKLEFAKLEPAPPAEPHILIRRMFLDLTGLPPGLKDVEHWKERLGGAAVDARPSEDRVAALIDRLLESNSYGERWGRHWLDVARYSDGYGGFLDDAPRPHAWRYRDWVVEAFNRDLSYNQFIRLQIAGDLIGDEKHDVVATGFLALGPNYHSDGSDPESVAQAKGETLDDRVDTISRGLLGITLSCARCHDHKFDPIRQLDYYSIAGVFNNTGVILAPLVADDLVNTYNAHQKAIEDQEKRVKSLQDKGGKENRQLSEGETKQLAAYKHELDQLKKTAPAHYDAAHALSDIGSADMKVALRGNPQRPGEVAPRRFLRILTGDNSPRFTEGSGRVELAEAMVSPDNPLTARVIVNRVWSHHFGKALVRSPSNFGLLGQRPTHPELLDWLAASFIESGWSIKQLHRTIMQSATYQMSSRFNRDHFNVDGDNKLIWRMNPRRLDVESWRDSLLAATHELDIAMGGPPVEDITKSRRRTLYAKVSRDGGRFAADEFLRKFDFPLMRATVAKRPTSIVPQQYLFLMNSPFMVERAKALVGRLQVSTKANEERIKGIYELLYLRHPRDEELQLALQFLSGDGATKQSLLENAKLSQWEQYAQVLLSANEFMYVR